MTPNRFHNTPYTADLTDLTDREDRETAAPAPTSPAEWISCSSKKGVT